MKRLFTYLKPHRWTMAVATFLVLLIIVVELYRPVIIGDAIDHYINGYYEPYREVAADIPEAVAYRGIYLAREKGSGLEDGTEAGQESSLADSAELGQGDSLVDGVGSSQGGNFGGGAESGRDDVLSVGVRSGQDGSPVAGAGLGQDDGLADGVDAGQGRGLADTAGLGQDSSFADVAGLGQDGSFADVAGLGQDGNLADRTGANRKGSLTAGVVLGQGGSSVDGTDVAQGGNYYQILLYGDRYYMAGHLTAEECEQLKNGDNALLAAYVGQGAALLSREELKELRRYDFTGILAAAGVYLVLLLLGFGLNAADTWMLQKMGQSIIYRMREEVFAHIHSLSLSFFNTTPVGKLVTRVANDTEAVNELFSTILVKLFKNVVKIIGYAVVMLSIHVRMAIVSFLLLPLVSVLTFFFRSLSRKAYQITRTKITELNTFLSEHISGMKLIQVFAREKEKYQEFEGKSGELFAANWREVMTFAVFRPIIYLLSIVAMVVVIGTGSASVLDGTLSLGTLFIFISYISSFFEPIQELAEQFGTLQSSLASAEKLFSILDEKPQIVSPVHPVDVRIRGRIEFKHVWFAYEKEDYILQDVSFVIEPGQKVAFVGATGAGKSSVLNLIGRYYDIQKGEILISGVNIRDIDTDVLRAAIGQVQQDVFIFTGDIKSNISLGNENISLEDIKRAARIVDADSFIRKMPSGYDEPVTERGSTLSAGQRQLLSFARTLAYDPAILVLDEATANIDTETEGMITQALGKLMEGRTTIMVAHRLSTIQHADKIIVMHKGKIREAGNHQELLRQDGLYKKLYELQLMDS